MEYVLYIYNVADDKVAYLITIKQKQMDKGTISIINKLTYTLYNYLSDRFEIMEEMTSIYHVTETEVQYKALLKSGNIISGTVSFKDL